MKSPSRRSFLQSTAGLPLLGAVRRAGSATAAPLPESTLPLGFGTYGLPDYSLAEAIDLIANTGFDTIEIAAMPGFHGAPDQLPPAQRKATRQRLAGSGLRLGALMGLPKPDASKQAENTEWVEQLLTLALDLSPDHPPLIQSVLGGGRWEEKKTLFRDTLGPWVQLASEAGVQLAIKPHRGHAMSRPEHGVWLIEQLDAAGKLALVYDYSHYAFRGMTVDDTVATALPHTAYLVMKDAVKEANGKVRFQLPGESGAMPHAEILRKFYEGGYRGEVCCEVSSQVWRQDGYDPVEATRTCHRNLEAIFAGAGIPMP